ncbi:hypothetical protein Acr_25g0002140 [Actinidia rufa]|uniref:Uncharacterized protein n=1 Tax=Actinidia rufa TaxID=165716 RepID=A0A7J0GY95_9ERIC|nr:hypothetical protein Acr_25g0002140 [Actinidia rufa]
MADKVTRLPSSFREDPSSFEGNPSANPLPPIEKEINTMTQYELDHLRESCSILSSIQIKLPESDETIASTHPGKAEEDPIQGTQQCQGVEEEILLYLGGQLGAPLRAILGSWGSKDLEVVGHPNGKDNAENKSAGDAAQVIGDEGESYHSRDEHPRGDHSRDGSVEYTGTIRKGMMKILPHLPYITLLRLLGESPTACPWFGTRWLELELKLGGLVRSTTSPQAQIVWSKCSTPVAKGVVIGEKCPRDEVLDISPTKKGKFASDSKGKGTMSQPEAKKKATKSKATSNKIASKGAMPIMAPGKGTFANSGDVLGLNASMLENPTVAKKVLGGVIPPFNKEKVQKLDLDRAISRLFYGVGQVITHLQIKIAFPHFHSSNKFNFLQVVVLASSIVGRGRELKEEAMTQQARANSAVEELRKLKEDWDATVGRLKKEEVEQAASKYFGKGFDLCKKQVGRLHPELDIHDLEIENELDKEREDDEEENDEEKDEEKGDQDTSTLSP